jgi:ribosomal protein S4
MFDRRLPAVVPMDHRYLAANDGSEMASGRGMGKDQDPLDMNKRDGKRIEKTPYMHMTFWPLERRLDTVIHRALFASSVSQARQFVVHGFVKVNGKKMRFPGYQLNPGDMFSVEPEMVLFATGAKKIKKDSPASPEYLMRKYEERLAKEKQRKSVALEETDEEEAEVPKVEQDAEAEAEVEAEAETEADGKKHSTELKQLVRRAKNILDDSKLKLSGKRQQELRSFTQDVKTVFSKINAMEDATAGKTVEDFETALAEILVKVPNDSLPASETVKADTTSSNRQMQKSGKQDAYRARKDAELLHAALEMARANPMDPEKPYATPWEPRAYMSAFAFIPRYLEVNQNICSGVYLRHPVARPGLAEVPTPFSSETMTLGFNWYLRRR